jgi:uncharacterized delta-60 repeat protein
MFGRRRTPRSRNSGASRSALQRREIVNGASRFTVLEHLEVRRLLDASTPDPTFGTGGVVLDPQGGPLAAGAVVVDGSGTVWAAGNPGTPRVARYSASGTALGTITLTGWDDVNGIALAPGNKVVVVGSASQDLIVTRFDSDGTPDGTFGVGGTFQHGPTVEPETAAGVVVRNDGSILVAGNIDDGDKDFFAIQIVSNGSGLNAGFGTGGSVQVDVPAAAEVAFGVAAQSDGSVVIVGESTPGGGDQDFALVRISSSGVASAPTIATAPGIQVLTGVAVGAGDAIFASGIDGTLREYDSSGAFVGSTAVLGLEAGAFGVAVDNDGNVLVTGASATVDTISVTRFDSAGNLDTNFGTGGNVQTSTGGGFVVAFDIAVQADDKLVVLGSSDNDFALVRYGTGGGGNVVVAELVGSTLIITGTTNPDDVRVVLSGSLLDVLDNNVSIGTFAAGGTTITFDGSDGDDRFEIATNVTNPSEIHGGAGSDTIIGGGGRDIVFGEANDDWLRARGSADILVGGDGDDVTAGGSARDVMIGGNGADRMAGDAESDILISGSTSFDTDVASLKLIQAEWLSGGSIFQRVNNLQNGTGLNGAVVLLEDQTVFDDNARDTLTGGSGSDWFLIHLNSSNLDIITDLNGAELMAVLDFILTT